MDPVVGGSTVSVLECPVCFEVMAIPKCLRCGHTVCADCLKKELTSRGRLRCPTCRRYVDLGADGVDGLPNNFALMSLKEQQSAVQKQQAVPSPISQRQQLDTTACERAITKIKNLQKKHDQQFESVNREIDIALDDLLNKFENIRKDLTSKSRVYKDDLMLSLTKYEDLAAKASVPNLNSLQYEKYRTEIDQLQKQFVDVMDIEYLQDGEKSIGSLQTKHHKEKITEAASKSKRNKKKKHKAGHVIPKVEIKPVNTKTEESDVCEKGSGKMIEALCRSTEMRASIEKETMETGEDSTTYPKQLICPTVSGTSSTCEDSDISDKTEMRETHTRNYMKDQEGNINLHAAGESKVGCLNTMSHQQNVATTVLKPNVSNDASRRNHTVQHEAQVSSMQSLLMQDECEVTTNQVMGKHSCESDASQHENLRATTGAASKCGATNTQDTNSIKPFDGISLSLEFPVNHCKHASVVRNKMPTHPKYLYNIYSVCDNNPVCTFIPSGNLVVYLSGMWTYCSITENGEVGTVSACERAYAPADMTYHKQMDCVVAVTGINIVNVLNARDLSPRDCLRLPENRSYSGIIASHRIAVMEDGSFIVYRDSRGEAAFIEIYNQSFTKLRSFELKAFARSITSLGNHILITFYGSGSYCSKSQYATLDRTGKEICVQDLPARCNEITVDENGYLWTLDDDSYNVIRVYVYNNNNKMIAAWEIAQLFLFRITFSQTGLIALSTLPHDYRDDCDYRQKITVFRVSENMCSACLSASHTSDKDTVEVKLSRFYERFRDENCCWFCSSFKIGSNLKTCIQCKRAKYCDVNCQRKDWRKTHKNECKPKKQNET